MLQHFDHKIKYNFQWHSCFPSFILNIIFIHDIVPLYNYLAYNKHLLKYTPQRDLWYFVVVENICMLSTDKTQWYSLNKQKNITYPVIKIINILNNDKFSFSDKQNHYWTQNSFLLHLIYFYFGNTCLCCVGLKLHSSWTFLDKVVANYHKCFTESSFQKTSLYRWSVSHN